MYSPSLQIMFPLIASIFMLCTGNVLRHRDNQYNMVTYTPLEDDDNIDITEDLLEKWNSACQSTTGGTIIVPPGTFLVNTMRFKGPCNGPMTFDVNGNLKAASDDSSTSEEYWILFSNVDGLTVSGNGSFDGQGQNVWNNCKSDSCPNRPVSLKFNSVTNATIQGISSINSKFFHFHIYGCENINVNGVSIDAPGDSPNTDGIHISNSNNVQVNEVHVATGDDCISLGDGTTNINISNVNCGPGHGISIGSLGRTPGEHPVHGIFISDSNLTGTTNGLRIKTFASSINNTVSNVTFQNIMINNVNNPIIIDQNYCPDKSCRDLDKGDSQVRIRNVRFINIKGTSASKVSVNLHCSGSVPCQGIVLQDIDLTYEGDGVPTKATCFNFNGTFDENQVPPGCSNIVLNQREFW